MIRYQSVLKKSVKKEVVLKELKVSFVHRNTHDCVRKIKCEIT